MDIGELLGLGSWWNQLIFLLVTSSFVAVLYLRHIFSHWDREGIASVSGSFPLGSIGGFIMMRKSISEVFQDIYRKGEGKPIVGYYSFTTPAICVRELDVVRNVLVKDYNYFSDRGIYYNESQDPLSAHLFSLDGEKWKNLRVKLSPTYTSGKMKYMYDTVKGCAKEFLRYIHDVAEKDDVFEVKELVAKFGINVIAVTAIGMEGHNLREDSELSQMAFQVTDPSNLIQAFRFTVPFISKNVAELFKLRFTPKGVSDYYLDMVRKIIEYRSQSGTERNDFMQLLIDINKKAVESAAKEGSTDTPMTVEEMAAQTFIFILAGYESLSSVISFCLYELAMNPEVQDKLAEEIDAAEDDIGYEKLLELPYLDMVFKETLRKYPPGGILIRLCVNNYKMSDGYVIKKGTKVIVPVFALHRDPKLFPDPDRFDPERFNKESPSQTVQPFSYLPFGDGPRFCIGKRFGVMQAKLGLLYIIKHFRIITTEKTIVPPRIEPKTFVINPNEGMMLRFVSRS